MKRYLNLLLAFCIILSILLVAGCGGGGQTAQRISGLTADGVVRTAFEAAKAGNLSQAGAYIAPNSGDVSSSLTKYLGLSQIKNSNLLSLKKVAEQGNYSVVVATIQAKENSLDITVKPIGLEKINGEWYIVDFDKIYQDAKYKLLLQLMSGI